LGTSGVGAEIFVGLDDDSSYANGLAEY